MKKAYAKPKLNRYGNVEEITLRYSGKGGDRKGKMSQRSWERNLSTGS